MRDDRFGDDDREERRTNPMKWIVLITAVLLVYAWVTDDDDHGGRSYAATGQFQNWEQNWEKNWEKWEDFDSQGGQAYQDVRELTGFESVKLRGRVKLDVKVGEAASVSLEGNEKAVKAIRAYVKDGTLILAQRGKGWSWNKLGPVTAHITLPSLEQLDIAGSSSVDIKGLQSGGSSIVISGTGRLTAEGKLDSLQLVINGAGRADLTAMAVDDAMVLINGAGGVSVDVHKTLVATVNGTGHVRYSGKPEHVTSAVHGVGSVRQI